MLTLAIVAVFVSLALLVLAFSSDMVEERPSLNLKSLGVGAVPNIGQGKPRKTFNPFVVLKVPAVLFTPLITAEMRVRMNTDLQMAGMDMSPEVFMLFKSLIIAALLMTLPGMMPSDMQFFAVMLCIAAGYFLPEMIVKSKVKKIKDEIIRLLPDTVDLLGLCVNAGLDFMLALKWVVDKSAPSVVTREMDNILQEISVGKPRRDALRDLAKKYDLQDLSTFSRTLIQADKMGTSVSEALSILSEDMRLARYRRGEAMALKAPLKMLVPLLFCIFPVVFILVGAPIFIDFVMNNPMQKLGH